MRSELSEFSYGFAITAELRDVLRPWAVEAPVFPTLRDEARLGWDVKLPVVGRSLFIQFKVAEALTRPSASEWVYYLTQYYRFPLHRLSRSDQHNRLRSLSQVEPFVFYVAPRFYRLEEFNGRYRSSTVVNDSAWIPVLSLPAVGDDKQHHVTYRTGLDVRFGSPESGPIRRTFDGERWRNYVAHELETKKTSMTVEGFSRLRAELLNALRREHAQHIPDLPMVGEEESQLLKDIAYLSRTFFGAEFFFVHERQK